MSSDVTGLPDHLTVSQAQATFKRQLSDSVVAASIFIVSGEKLRGILSASKLLQERDGNKSITQLMSGILFQAKPSDTRQDIAQRVAEQPQRLIPVVENDRLVGCLGEREIARLRAAEITEDAQRQGATQPLEIPYLETTPFTLWKKRAVWLLFLFVAQAYTSSVIEHYEHALESAIALAFFIPLLIGTGGNSGTQITSTLVRAMALGEVRLRDLGKIIRKEISTAMLIALTLGCAGYARAWMMGIGPDITVIVSITLVCITLWSSVISSVTPMVLKRLGIDPAVVSAPFISTLIDGTGLIIYFNIAQYFLGIP
ncbi:magnesium transporter [Enterobacteriaceae bacterium 4M9]|nr:magnesium transporter [Enterobacteriaceae bacterium 4M9]